VIPLARHIAALVINPTTGPDLRYEAVAFLLHMDRRDLVQVKWLDQIATRAAAGWCWKYITGEGGAMTRHHHGCWALLQTARPDAHDEPVLRRPSH